MMTDLSHHHHLFLLCLFLFSLHYPCNAYVLYKSSLCRQLTWKLHAKKSKDELDSIVAGMGLKPVGKRPKKKKKKKKMQPPPPPPSLSSSANPSILLQMKGKKKQDVVVVSLDHQLDYSRNGHCCLRSFLEPSRLERIRKDVLAYTSSRELEAWRQKVEVVCGSPSLAQACRTIDDCQEALAYHDDDDDGEGGAALPFLQFFNLWRTVASVRDLCFGLGQTASVLLDVPSVCLYQDSVFSKRPQDGPTPWHIDARMAPFDTTHMVTFWIPLQDVPRGTTALRFVSKSHNDYALPYWNPNHQGPEFQRLDRRYATAGGIQHYMPLQLGDVTVHSGWTLHCADAAPAATTTTRHAIAITYVDARAEIRENAMEFDKNNHGGYGDNEDQWSYKDWIHEVPTRKTFRHHLVPIVWPPQQQP